MASSHELNHQPSNEEFEEAIAKFFCRFDSSNPDIAICALTDNDVSRISDLLRIMNRIPWSLNPRTYIVVRLVDQLHIIDSLIEQGYTDNCFPYTIETLPIFLDHTTKARFLKAQTAVLTPGFRIERGEHVCFTEEAPFEFKKLLSHKNSSRVTVVTVLVSHKEYTRKNISRKSRQDYKRYIEKLEIWKKVRHRHLVTLVGSYLDNRSFGFIMSPVAEMNLESFLELAPSSAEKGTLLRQFFGCLACALKFLHENNIRHGNIRPSNILVHGENVLFTDVGFNRPNQENSGSTTTGAEPAFDLYSSPEQQNEFRQSFSSDIWSLGWVFLDMETVLKGERTEKMHSFMLGGRSNWNVLQNLNKVQKWTVELKKRGNLDDNAPFEWVMGMLKPNDRPEAKKLVNEILKLSTISNSPTFCGACCIENKKFP